MATLLIKNATIINRGQQHSGDIYCKDGFIEQVGGVIDRPADTEIDATGLVAMPGIIDDQVHFREPGLTHKADIGTESRAAIAGGVTSFMEMPNVKPPTLTQELLAEKYAIAAKNSPANYSFYMGAGNDNLEEVLKTDPKTVCGLKIFMGSSTGNMLVDDEAVLEKLFAQVPMLIATHCEDEQMIRENMSLAKAKFGDDVPMRYHPDIRPAKACYKSSSLAVELARRYNTRLHVLHITTKDEIALFDNTIPLAEKRITAEVCVHHLYFNSEDYERLGTKIKCNPAIKGVEHQSALLPALLDGYFDVIATDHAPHTLAEKNQNYFAAPSGLPLIQHSLNVMLELYHRGDISLKLLVDKMCHAPAICYQIDRRGYLDPGYWADIVLVDLNEEWTVEKENIFYKCGWSPFEGHTFRGRVKHTVVSGHHAFRNGKIDDSVSGRRLTFDRD
jgi:dihydroorotase